MAPQDEHYPKSGTLGKKERPILLNDEMVRAVLEGRKTQTRRVCKFVPLNPGLNLKWSGLSIGHYCTDVPSSGFVLYSRDGEMRWQQKTQRLHCPFGAAGDRLWVREAWNTLFPSDTLQKRKSEVQYRATNPEAFEYLKARPSIHMPRWASRITLEITGVRAQRLQDISEEDADAEAFGGDFPHKVLPDLFSQDDGNLSIVQCFARLWDSIYSKPCKKCKGQGCITAWTGSENGSGVAIDSEDCPKCKGSQPNSWESNPWVWVIEFRRVES